MSAKKIAIIGECMIELTGKPFGTMCQNYGGDTINTAIYLKMLAQKQLDVNYFTAMGSDPLSQAIVAKWQQHGITTDNVLINLDKHAGLYLIQTDDQGERSFQYWRNDSAARYLLQHPDFSKAAQKLADFDAIYLSGISLAILPPEDCWQLLSLIEQLKAKGVKFIYDSNYRQSLWHSHKHCLAVSEKAYSLSDLALLTFDDERAIWQDSNLEACTSRLHDQGVKELVMKLGEQGCQVSFIDEQGRLKQVSCSTAPVAKVVDSTAAGDSFNAGYLSKWLLNQPTESAAAMANHLAGQVIQHRGAIIPQAKLSLIN